MARRNQLKRSGNTHHCDFPNILIKVIFRQFGMRFQINTTEKNILYCVFRKVSFLKITTSISKYDVIKKSLLLVFVHVGESIRDSGSNTILIQTKREKQTLSPCLYANAWTNCGWFEQYYFCFLGFYVLRRSMNSKWSERQHLAWVFVSLFRVLTLPT